MSQTRPSDFHYSLRHIYQAHNCGSYHTLNKQGYHAYTLQYTPPAQTQTEFITAWTNVRSPTGSTVSDMAGLFISLPFLGSLYFKSPQKMSWWEVIPLKRALLHTDRPSLPSRGWVSLPHSLRSLRIGTTLVLGRVHYVDNTRLSGSFAITPFSWFLFRVSK